MSADWQKRAIRDFLVGEHATFVFEPCHGLTLPDVSATNLYLHIPFCRSLCPYCPYNRILYDESLVAPYARAVHREIERYRELLGDIEIGSVYIGGGTPTTLLSELGPILDHVRQRFRLTGSIAIETIPTDLDETSLATLKSIGVGLLSIGVQSFDDHYQRLIGRRYRSPVLPGAITRALETGFDMVNIDLDDQATFSLLSRGDTTGVFQLESAGMKDLLVRLKPASFADITALVALYRPGPLDSGMVDDFVERKHGRKAVEYLLPELAPILEETYGVILYQEQVMKIAAVLANYTMAKADDLRKAMGKKIAEKMAEHRQFFMDGAKENQIPEDKAGTVFDLMEKFGGYGFNKSHSAAYALIAYQTAYLKAHYPVEFLAALLTSEMHSTDGVVKFMAECRSHGIDPYEYLRDVLTRLPSMTNWQIPEVTPRAWAAASRCPSFSWMRRRGGPRGSRVAVRRDRSGAVGVRSGRSHHEADLRLLARSPRKGRGASRSQTRERLAGQ